MGRGLESQKVRKTYSRAESAKIKPTPIEGKGHLSLNFRYLIGTNSFNYQCRNRKYFLKLIDRLKQFCVLSREDFTCRCFDKPWRAHRIKWSNPGITERSFGLSPDVGDEDAWQFSVSSNKHGRIHGFLIDEIFYVRWFDPDHNLYSD